MQKRPEGGGKTLWARLVASAREMDGHGCDGMLLREAEKYTEKLLTRLNRQDMYDIWTWTQNGVMALAEGLDEPERFEMIHDIGLDVIEEIVGDICREARKKTKRKKRP